MIQPLINWNINFVLLIVLLQLSVKQEKLYSESQSVLESVHIQLND